MEDRGSSNLLLVVLAHLNLNTPSPRTKPSNRSPRPSLLRQRVTKRHRQQVVALYQSGLSTRMVADQTGVSKTTVLNILKEAAIELRTRGNPNFSKQ